MTLLYVTHAFVPCRAWLGQEEAAGRAGPLTSGPSSAAGAPGSCSARSDREGISYHGMVEVMITPKSVDHFFQGIAIQYLAKFRVLVVADAITVSSAR